MQTHNMACKCLQVSHLLLVSILDLSLMTPFRSKDCYSIGCEWPFTNHKNGSLIPSSFACQRVFGLDTLRKHCAQHWPYYLLREFSHVISLCVYIPPGADATTACEKIHTVTAKLQTQHSEAFIIISGDFNHFTLDSTLAAFHQVVDCPTRNNRTIDLLYTNIKEAYRVTTLPLLDKSDHDLVYIQPQYNPLVQRQSVATRSIRRRTPEVEEALRGCYDTTDWVHMVRT